MKKSQKNALSKNKQSSLAKDHLLRQRADASPEKEKLSIKVIKQMLYLNSKFVRTFNQTFETTKTIETIRIATVVLPVREKLIEVPNKKDRSLSQFIIKDELFVDHLDSFLDAIKKACSLGANFVCAGELAFPNSDKKQFQKPIKFFEDEIKKLSQKGTYIIPGSFHNKDFFGVSPVFHNNRNISNPFPHKKANPATKVHEKLKTDPEKKLYHYTTEFGSFSIFICLDSYDAALVSKLLAYNYRGANINHHPINILFVPSLNKDVKDALDGCKMISYGAGNIVVFVDCKNYCKQGHVFALGKEMKRNEAESENNISVFDVDFSAFQKERLKISNEYSNMFKYVLDLEGLITSFK